MTKRCSFTSRVTMRLLLVEPDTRLAERLQESLESEGYVVDLVETLAEARETVGGADYAAVLMDLYETPPALWPGDHRYGSGPRTADEATSSPDTDIWFG
jgi:CheY-like chemotaxis protein